MADLKIKFAPNDTVSLNVGDLKYDPYLHISIQVCDARLTEYAGTELNRENAQKLVNFIQAEFLDKF